MRDFRLQFARAARRSNPGQARKGSVKSQQAAGQKMVATSLQGAKLIVVVRLWTKVLNGIMIKA